MCKLVWILISLLLCGCALHGDDKAHSVRVRFVPGSVPTSPLESGSGAVWSSLHPGPGGKLILQAWAGIGDKFPVQDKDDLLHFEVELKDGDDDHLSLDILSQQVVQKIDVQRDKPAQVQVAGIEYELTYPSVSVSSKENKFTTNKAMLLVTRVALSRTPQ